MSKPDEPRAIAPQGEDPSGTAPQSSESALGSDPFDAPSEADALGEWLDAAERLAKGRSPLGGGLEPATPDAGASIRELPRAHPAVDRPPTKAGTSLTAKRLSPKSILVNFPTNATDGGTTI